MGYWLIIMSLKSKETIKNYLADMPYQLQAVTYIYNYIMLYGKLVLRIISGKFLANIKYVAVKKKYPKVLQFPVTSRCNLNCKMCGLYNEKKCAELEPQQLNVIFANNIFKNIRSVGINGGEPFLNINLLDYVDIVIRSFPRLENIFIISNGTLANIMLTVLPEIKSLCATNNIKLTLSISIDGIGAVHDFVRGQEGAFEKVENICSIINSNLSRYCDDFGIICTLTKYNTYQINEVDVWAKYKNYNISYNIATQHVRLNTSSLCDDFTVFACEHTRLMSAEFFYGKFIETKSQTYYALFKYITTKKRATGCYFKYDGITILSDGSIAYCATRSKILGNALSEDAYTIFSNNLSYRKSDILSTCDTCSHYTGVLLLKDHIDYIREILNVIGSPFKWR